MAITVEKLIKMLQGEDPKRIVIMSSDSEGNGYSPLYSVSTCKYDDEEGEIGLEELLPEDEEDGYSEEDVMVGGKKALVLQPE